MKKKPRQITVITTLIMKKGHYVKKETRRNDGRYNVELTTNLKEAKEYSRQEANKVVEKIFNPYDREYAVEDTLVDWPKSAASMVQGDLE